MQGGRGAGTRRRIGARPGRRQPSPTARSDQIDHRPTSVTGWAWLAAGALRASGGVHTFRASRLRSKMTWIAESACSPVSRAREDCLPRFPPMHPPRIEPQSRRVPCALRCVASSIDRSSGPAVGAATSQCAGGLVRAGSRIRPFASLSRLCIICMKTPRRSLPPFHQRKRHRTTRPSINDATHRPTIYATYTRHAHRGSRAEP